METKSNDSNVEFKSKSPSPGAISGSDCEKANQEISSFCRRLKIISRSYDLGKPLDWYISQLEKIDKEFGELVRQFREPASPQEKEMLIKILDQLADISHLKSKAYKVKYDENTSLLVEEKDTSSKSTIADLVNFLRTNNETAVFCQYIIRLSEEYQEFKTKAEGRGQELWSDLTSWTDAKGNTEFNFFEKESKELFDKLAEIRKCSKANLKQEDTQELFLYIRKEMADLLSKVFEFAKGILSNDQASVPNHSIVGLGSMALGQITPYSDYEFAILTSDDKPETIAYFKKLSFIANFLVISFGETVIYTSRYKCDMGHLIKQAVNFDLGGKTSLGRADPIDRQYGKYELIGTPKKLLEYVKDAGGKWSKIDSKLSIILENVYYISGDEGLSDQYKGCVYEFFGTDRNDGLTEGQFRALKTLWGEGDEKINGDLYKFSPTILDQDRFHGQTLKAKQDIYRLPDRAIYSTSFLLKKDGPKEEYLPWNIIDKLFSKNDPSAEIFKYAFNYSLKCRLEVYSKHGCQKEIFLPKRNDKEFKNFSLIAITFYFKLKSFFEQSDYETNSKELLHEKLVKFFEEVDFLNISRFYEAMIEITVFIEYKEAINLLEDCLKEEFTKEYNGMKFCSAGIHIGKVYNELANTYHGIKQYAKAKHYYERAISEFKKSIEISHMTTYCRKNLKICKSNLLTTNLLSGDNEDESKKLLNELPTQFMKNDYNFILNTLVPSYFYIKEWQKVSELLNSLKEKDLSQNQLLTYYQKMADLCSAREKNEESLGWLKKEEDLLDEFFSKDHKAYGFLYSKMLYNYFETKNYDKSLELSYKVYETFNNFYGKDNEKTMTALYYIGRCNLALKKYDKASEYLERVNPELLEKSVQSRYYDTLGGVYYWRGEFYKAYESFSKAYTLLEDEVPKLEKQEFMLKKIKSGYSCGEKGVVDSCYKIFKNELHKFKKSYSNGEYKDGIKDIFAQCLYSHCYFKIQKSKLDKTLGDFNFSLKILLDIKENREEILAKAIERWSEINEKIVQLHRDSIERCLVEDFANIYGQINKMSEQYLIGQTDPDLVVSE